MALYNLYAGIIKPFSSIFDVSCHGTWECDNFSKAMTIAHDIAVDIYKSYEGQNGVMSWNDCADKFCNSKKSIPAKLRSMIDKYYDQQVNTWIFYYAYYKY